jgi:hypothetical protein
LPIPFPSTGGFQFLIPCHVSRPPAALSQNQIRGKKKEKIPQIPFPIPQIIIPFVLGLRLPPALSLRRARARPPPPPRPRRCQVISPSPLASISVKVPWFILGGWVGGWECHGAAQSGISPRRRCGWEWRVRASCFGSSGGAVGFEDRAFDGMTATVCPLPWNAAPTGGSFG